MTRPKVTRSKNEITRAPQTALSPAQLAEEVRRLSTTGNMFEDSAHASNTQMAYRKAWARFEAWCLLRGFDSLPSNATVLRLYVTALSTEGVPHADGSPGNPVGISTIKQHLAAITYAHEKMFPGMPSPEAGIPKRFLKGLRRAIAKTPVAKEWAPRAMLRQAIEKDPDMSLRGLRNRAMVLVGFDSGGRRRSEIVSMHVEHLRRTREGDYVWTIPQTKTSDTGMRTIIPRRGDDDPTCAVRALNAWLEASGITTGPVFRSVDRFGLIGEVAVNAKAVAVAVKELAEKVGEKPDDFAAHSLRSGFVTDMHRAGVSTADIQPFVGHKSIATTEGYKQLVDLQDDDNPVRDALRRL